jgi:hypothetical protein
LGDTRWADYPQYAATPSVEIAAMPVISRFLGITVVMYYRDHAPPHFHATYGNYEVTVEIETGMVSGRFPRRPLALLLEWWEFSHDNLSENWDRARLGLPLVPIAPWE